MIYVSESVWAATTTGGCQRVVVGGGGGGGRLQLISTLAQHNGFKSFQFFFSGLTANQNTENTEVNTMMMTDEKVAQALVWFTAAQEVKEFLLLLLFV